MTKINQPLSNTQLEILNTFSCKLSQKELKEFRNLIANYFASRTTELANKVWEEKGWTDEDVNRILNTKMRKSKRE